MLEKFFEPLLYIGSVVVIGYIASKFQFRALKNEKALEKKTEIYENLYIQLEKVQNQKELVYKKAYFAELTQYHARLKLFGSQAVVAQYEIFFNYLQNEYYAKYLAYSYDFPEVDMRIVEGDEIQGIDEFGNETYMYECDHTEYLLEQYKLDNPLDVLTFKQQLGELLDTMQSDIQNKKTPITEFRKLVAHVKKFGQQINIKRWKANLKKLIVASIILGIIYVWFAIVAGYWNFSFPMVVEIGVHS